MNIQTEHQHFVEKFRDATPYINAFRDKIFVIYFSESVLQSKNFNAFICDLTLLHSLGIKLVIVHGARKLIDEKLATNHEGDFIDDLRITDDTQLQLIKGLYGSIRFDIESIFTKYFNKPAQLTNIKQYNHLNIISGNFVTAKPIGVINGIDYLHTGKIRKINSSKINKLLDQENIILLSPLGSSPSGEIFNLNAADLATECAIQLNAEKLIFITQYNGLHDIKGQIIKEVSNQTLKKNILNYSLSKPIEKNQATTQQINREMKQIERFIYAADHGVNKIQLMNHQYDGAILLELFTNHGIGTLITRDNLEEICIATVDDISAIIQLIEPLENEGIILKRSREALEVEIDHFYIIKREQQVIACGALFPSIETNSAELACLAVAPTYQHSGRASKLFNYICTQAKDNNINSIYVLTTQTSHWFVERGFKKGKIEELPSEKQKLLNNDRNSQTFTYLIG